MEPGMVVYIDSPKIWQVEAGRLEVQVYHHVHTEFEATLDYIRLSQNKSQLTAIFFLRYLKMTFYLLG